MKIRRDLSFAERQIRFALCAGMPQSVTAEALGVSVNAIELRTRRLIRSYEMDTRNRPEFAVNVNAAVRDRWMPKR